MKRSTCLWISRIFDRRISGHGCKGLKGILSGVVVMNCVVSKRQDFAFFSYEHERSTMLGDDADSLKRLFKERKESDPDCFKKHETKGV